MIIHSLHRSHGADGTWTLSAIVTYETPAPRSFQAYFTAEDSPGEISASADPFLIQLLIPAMLLGEPLRVVGPVDPQLLATIEDNIKPLLLRWFPFLKDIPVHADRPTPPPPRSVSPLTAMTFSGGLDSAYTAAKHRDELDLLVVTQGLNVRSWHTDYWRKLFSGIRAAAAPFERPVMVVGTNIMEISHYQAIRTRRGRIDPRHYTLGGMGQLGTYLTAVGRSLDPFCSRFFLSAGVAYEDLTPYGSHPLLDPMWSTSRQQVFHDGCEASRLDKVAFLADRFPEALGRLHVCTFSVGPGLNCSRCEKCLRTMTEFRTCGVEALGNSFRWPLDPALVRTMKVRDRTREYWERLLDRALQRGDSELAEAIRAALPRKRALHRFWPLFKPPGNDRRRAREEWKRLRKVVNPPSTSAAGELPTDPRWLVSPPAVRSTPPLIPAYSAAPEPPLPDAPATDPPSPRSLSV